MTSLVDNLSYQFRAFFLYTLYKDVISIDRHPYGIKAYHVSYGIGHSLFVNAGSNGKIFKFVIDKVDLVLTGIRLYNLEDLRHGDVSEIMCDSLCTD
ncbi:hypothetical protein prwr041_11440 [Prevotella herbatica]|uniref:Uncharacterized protein n=1 Tax=Prevotella herbatica TaxID=2801997 RepID=A0ABN6EKF0_9BACT|nr:hypothetical protein prwr041_11440 [Prevotella herbatica]